MASVPSTRLLYSRLQEKRMNTQLGIVFQPTIDRLVSLVTSFGETIPPERLNEITAQAGKIVESTFVGSDGRNAFGADGITALAPFPRWLNTEMASIQTEVVLAHRDTMQRLSPLDVWQYLRTAKPKVSEQRPFLKYVPSHEWLDERGYTLSDRIWQTSQQTRAKIDALLRDGIRQGRGSLDIARDLRQFLQPGRYLKVTNKPYGTTASFDGMRLARTEISRAHAQASMASSLANPYVNGIDTALARRHKCCDNCDDLTTIDENGRRKREPYTLQNAVIPPYHPHCICVSMPAMITSREDVIAALRQQLGLEPAPLTPAVPYAFLLDLLGSAFMAYVDYELYQELVA